MKYSVEIKDNGGDGGGGTSYKTVDAPDPLTAIDNCCGINPAPCVEFIARRVEDTPKQMMARDGREVVMVNEHGSPALIAIRIGHVLGDGEDTIMPWATCQFDSDDVDGMQRWLSEKCKSETLKQAAIQEVSRITQLVASGNKEENDG